MGILKIAIKNGLTNASPTGGQLLDIEKDDNFIKSCIESCIDKWSLDIPVDNEITDEYALVVERNDQGDTKLMEKVVTNDNWSGIQDAAILKLTYATKILVKNILESLETHGNSGSDFLIERLKANDNDFLDELITENDGISVILNRLSYDLDTHEDSPMINILLEVLCIIILQYPGSEVVLPAIEEKEDLIKVLIEGMDVQNWDAEQRKNWDEQRMKHAGLFLTVIQKKFHMLPTSQKIH